LKATLAALLVAASSFAAHWSAIDTGLPTTSFGVRTLAIDPATPSTLYALTGAGIIFKSTDAGGSWRRAKGIFEVYFLAIASKNSTLYAITSYGVVKSLDGGESWKTASSGLTGDAFSLAINPIDPSMLYAVTLHGIFKSANGGENWTVIASGSSSSTPLFGLVIDPTTPSTLYALYSNRILVKSTDGGESWTPIQPDSTVDYPITSVAIDPANSSTIYASYLPQSFTPGESPTGGVFKSMDGGNTWNAYQQGMPATFFVTALTIDPLAPSTIYAVVKSNKGGGVVKSTDGGQSWTAVDDGLPSNFSGPLAIDPGAPSNIYAGCSDDGCGAVFKSTLGGGSWKGAGAGLTRIDASVLTIGPGGTLYAGVRDGLFQSSDDGASWANLHSFQIAGQSFPPGVPGPPFGAGPAVVHSLLIDFTNPDVLYVETTRAGGCAFNDKVVFKSADAGVSWDDSISPPESGCVLGGFAAFGTLIAMDPLDPKTLYLGETEDEDGVYALLKSSDGGAHWASIWNYNNGLQSDLNAVAVDPGSPATLYAGVGDAGYFTNPGSTGTGVIKSTDGGATWNATGLKDTAATLLVIDRADPSILYAGTQGIYTEPRGFRGLFKSIDSGASWLPVNNGLTGLADIGATITALVIAPNHSNILYAGTSRDGIYKSVDGAATWVKFNDGLTSLEIRALAVSPSSQNMLYAASSDGIFKLIDETPAP
jgi:photosystem II stability/assembly factor-like uncharacterized protein